MSAPGQVTLGQVVDVLGTETLRLLTPALADVPVVRPRLYDAHETDDADGLAAGDLVLGINVTADAVAVLEQVAAAGAPALALKGDVGPLVAEAERLGVALLAVAAPVRWEQLFALLQRATSESVPEPEDAPGLGDLFAFANALAALVGGAVAVEDPHGALLAYSNLDQPIDEPRRQTILGRGNPRHWSDLLAEEGYARQLATADGPVRISDPEARAAERVAALVRAGDEVLGSVWVVAGDAPLGPEAEQVVADALPLAALHLLRQRAVVDSRRAERGELLRRLLAGDRVDLGRLGLDAQTRCVVVAFQVLGTAPDTPDDGPALVVGRRRLADAVALAGEAFRRQVVSVVVDDVVYALFPDVRPSGDALARLLEDLCARSSKALGARVVAAVSFAQDAGSAARCRDEADQVLRVLRERSGPQVAGPDDVRTAGVLLRLGDLLRERPDLRVPGVEVLAQHDAEHGKHYVESLRAYLRSGSIPAAAAALGIHANTLRYRISRIEELSGLLLDDADARLVAMLELLARS